MERFSASVPGADGVLAEHRDAYGGVLPHVLMAELRRFFVAAVKAGDDGRVAAFASAVETLAGTPDPDVRNVVEISFAEDLVQGADEEEQAALEALRVVMGPATRSALAHSEDAA